MTSKVHALPQRFKTQIPTNPFDELTDTIVLAQAAAGTLDPAIVAALLAAVRLPAGEGGR